MESYGTTLWKRKSPLKPSNIIIPVEDEECRMKRGSSSVTPILIDKSSNPIDDNNNSKLYFNFSPKPPEDARISDRSTYVPPPALSFKSLCRTGSLCTIDVKDVKVMGNDDSCLHTNEPHRPRCGLIRKLSINVPEENEDVCETNEWIIPTISNQNPLIQLETFSSKDNAITNGSPTVSSPHIIDANESEASVNRDVKKPFTLTIGLRSALVALFTVIVIIAILVVWIVMFYISRNMRAETVTGFNRSYKLMTTNVNKSLDFSTHALSKTVGNLLIEMDHDRYLSNLNNINSIPVKFAINQLSVNNFYMSLTDTTLNHQSVQYEIHSLVGRGNGVANTIFVVRHVDGAVIGYDRTLCFPASNPTDYSRSCLIRNTVTNGKFYFTKYMSDRQSGLETMEVLQNPTLPIADYDIRKESWYVSVTSTLSSGNSCFQLGVIPFISWRMFLTQCCAIRRGTDVQGVVCGALNHRNLPKFDSATDDGELTNPLENIHVFNYDSRAFWVQVGNDLMQGAPVDGYLSSVSNGYPYAIDKTDGHPRPILSSASDDLLISTIGKLVQAMPGGYLSFVAPVGNKYAQESNWSILPLNIPNVAVIITGLPLNDMNPLSNTLALVIATNTTNLYKDAAASLKNGDADIQATFVSSSNTEYIWMVITVFISFGVIAVGMTLIFLSATIIVDYFTILRGHILKVSQLEFAFDDDGVENHEIFRLRISEIQSIREIFNKMKLGLESFSKFVPRTVVRRIVSGDEHSSQIYFENRRVTVVFSDIANFTNICDTVPIEKLVYPFIEYLTNMSNVVEQNDGTVGDYMGDGIIAIYGAPDHVEYHAHRACKAALEQLRLLNTLNESWTADDVPLIYCRIGINTGDVYCGNLGSPSRLKYDVIGAEVNFASRLEGVNKKYGTSILISESTFNLAKDTYLCRPVDTVIVVGIAKPSRVYELLIELEGASSENMTFAREFTSIFELYTAGNFSEVIMECERFLASVAPNDRPAMVLLERSLKYLADPPKHWDGVTTLDFTSTYTKIYLIALMDNRIVLSRAECRTLLSRYYIKHRQANGDVILNADDVIVEKIVSMHPSKTLTSEEVESLWSYSVPLLSKDGACSMSHELDPVPFNVSLMIMEEDEEVFAARRCDWTSLASELGPRTRRYWRLKQIVECLSRRLESEWAGVYCSMTDSSHSCLTLMKESYVGEYSRALFPLTQSFATQSNNSFIGLNGGCVVIRDTYATDCGTYYQCSGNVHSEICCAIVDDENDELGRVFGIVDVEAWRVDQYTEDKIAVLLHACRMLARHWIDLYN